MSINLLIILTAGIFALLIQQFLLFLKEWPGFKLKLVALLEEWSQYFSEYYSVTREQQKEWITQLANQSAADLLQMLRESIAAYSLSMVLFILIPVFSALILYYRHILIEVLFRIFQNETRDRIRTILKKTVHTYYNFIKGMIIVYLIVGVLNSIGLLILGIPHAILFGFTASILTFIPYLGIMVGSLLPITVAWATYNSVWYAVGVVGVFSIVQYLEANVIFPLAVSNKLKINALVTLMAIVLGGILWGVAGVILFIPFLAISKLIADHNPKLKTWSILIGT